MTESPKQQELFPEDSQEEAEEESVVGEDSNPYVLYVCDVETTGKDPKVHDIIEICLWRISDGQSKTWCLKPLNPEAIEDEALAVNKHKREDILHKTAHGRQTYLPPDEVLPEIEMWLMEDGAAAEDRVFIGQNVMFDYEHCVELWKKVGSPENFPFGMWQGTREDLWNQGFLIDTMMIARLIDIATGKRRKRYGLGGLVKDFGVTRATAHRADGDVKMTQELFLKMFEPLAKIMKEQFSDKYA
jgi:DNA polymerase III epsilon subunit-like protein